jgi:hypothetical protein
MASILPHRLPSSACASAVAPALAAAALVALCCCSCSFCHCFQMTTSATVIFCDLGQLSGSRTSSSRRGWHGWPRRAAPQNAMLSWQLVTRTLKVLGNLFLNRTRRPPCRRRWSSAVEAARRGRRGPAQGAPAAQGPSSKWLMPRPGWPMSASTCEVLPATGTRSTPAGYGVWGLGFRRRRGSPRSGPGWASCAGGPQTHVPPGLQRLRTTPPRGTPPGRCSRPA